MGLNHRDGSKENGEVRDLEDLPPGYETRSLTLDDIRDVYELEAAGEAFDDGMVEVELSDLRADWGRPDFHPDTMSVGVFTAGTLAAYAQVFQGKAEAMVHPDHRGNGIGGALARWTWDRARAEGRTSIGQTISENEHAAEALFRVHGYEPTHTAWILRVALGPDEPASPDLPAGYGFRAYHPGRDDLRVFTLIDTAFQEWRSPDSRSMGFDNWRAWALHDVDPALVVLLKRGRRLVGAAIGHDSGQEAEGWIDQIAVDRAHRGQGLGRALLEECFRRFWRLGRSQCAVSTDSRTGALALYEHEGMSVRRSYTRWTKTGI